MHRYRDIVGGKDLNDCFPCPAGYWCNLTGMVNYNNSECPIGHFCPSQLGPSLCGAGRRRENPGAGSRDDCGFCPGGHYCPNDTINIQGIPCKAKYYCPEGSSAERLCPGGAYCPATTAIPIPCPGMCLSLYHYLTLGRCFTCSIRHLVNSCCRAPVYRAGGEGFKP